jgi:hypothetical protein
MVRLPGRGAGAAGGPDILVDVVEHGAVAEEVAVGKRAEALGLLLRLDHLGLEVLLQLLVLGIGPDADRDHVLLHARERIAQREALPVVGGAILGRIVGGRVRAGAVGDPLDEGGPQVGAGPLGGPARGGVTGEEVVAIHAQRRDPAAHAARREGGFFAARERLERRDRPLVVDDVENHGGAVHVREGERRVEVRFRRRAVADPAGGDARVALDRARHGPAYRLDELGRQVAGDREEAAILVRVHHRELPALQGIALVRQQLADHPDHGRVVVREEQALLAIGREVHVADFERELVRAADRFLAQALHVERGLLLALGDEHAVVEDARADHARRPRFSWSGESFGSQGPTALPSSSRTRMRV